MLLTIPFAIVDAANNEMLAIVAITNAHREFAIVLANADPISKLIKRMSTLRVSNIKRAHLVFSK